MPDSHGSRQDDPAVASTGGDWPVDAPRPRILPGMDPAPNPQPPTPPAGGPLRLLRAAAGRARRGARAVVDRLLHPRRRGRALDVLRSLPRVENVVFVCHGNIYRSPYAEAFFRARVEEGGGRCTICSAGFVGPDRPAPDPSQELARSRGLDLSAHRSQLLNPAIVRAANLIVVMTAAQKSEIVRRFGYPERRVLVLGDLDPQADEGRDVIDPWNRPPEVLVQAADRIERCTEILAATVLERTEGGGEGPPGAVRQAG